MSRCACSHLGYPSRGSFAGAAGVADGAGSPGAPVAGGFWPVVDCAETGVARAASTNATTTVEMEPRTTNMEPAPPSLFAGKHAMGIQSFSCLDVVIKGGISR